VSQVEAVDEAKGVVLLYRDRTIAHRAPALPRFARRLSFRSHHQRSGTHGIRFSPSAASYVDTYSNAMTPPRRDTYAADGSKLAALEEDKVPELAEYHLSPVEFFTIKSHDGVTLNCSMIKPPQFRSGKKISRATFTYGGPHAQVVLNTWSRSAIFLWHQMMAKKGYIIFLAR